MAWPWTKREKITRRRPNTQTSFAINSSLQRKLHVHLVRFFLLNKLLPSQAKQVQVLSFTKTLSFCRIYPSGNVQPSGKKGVAQSNSGWPKSPKNPLDIWLWVKNGYPKNPIGKGKNRPKPVVPVWVFFLTHSHLQREVQQNDPPSVTGPIVQDLQGPCPSRFRLFRGTWRCLSWNSLWDYKHLGVNSCM